MTLFKFYYFYWLVSYTNIIFYTIRSDCSRLINLDRAPYICIYINHKILYKYAHINNTYNNINNSTLKWCSIV